MPNASSTFGALLRSVKIIAGKFGGKEKTSPGMEPVVRALKDKPVDNPWAVAWSMYNKGEADAPIARRSRFLESSRIREATDALKLEGHIVEVVLISEGLGNLHDMNYYGPEALKTGVEAFEGADCFLNHPSEWDMKNIPERRVEDKCGYFKNIRIDAIKDMDRNITVNALVGELHLDQSSTGEMAFGKIKSAVHYRSEFPGSSKEYVGLSVNADGEAEERTMTIDGKEANVNYVTKFIKSVFTSCDIVTSPARGGRFLALVEDDTGAKYMSEEARMKLKKLIESALAALRAYGSEKDEANKVKKLAEAQKLLTEAEDETAEADILGIEAFARKEGEDEDAHKLRLGKLAAALKKEMEAYETEGEGEDDTEKPEPCDDHKDMESARLAVKQLIQESKLPKDFYSKEDLEELARLPFKEAKLRIAREARLAESVARQAAAKVALPSTFALKENSESGKTELVASGNEAFKQAFKEVR